MRSWLANLLRNLFGDAVARIFGGAGLALVTSAVMIPVVTTALNQAAAAFGGIPADILNVVLLFGFGEAMSIIGAAMLTRLAVQSANVGVRRATRP